jgi:hypothetical protein
MEDLDVEEKKEYIKKLMSKKAKNMQRKAFLKELAEREEKEK